MTTYNEYVIAPWNQTVTFTNAVFNARIDIMDGVLNLNGNSINNGTINTFNTYRDGANTINIQAGHELQNRGTIHFWQNGPYGSASNDVTGGSLINNGNVIVDGFAKITAEVFGKGTITFQPPYGPNSYRTEIAYTNVELDKYVGINQVINMHNDGVLTIGKLKDFHATVKEFTGFTQNSDLSLATQSIVYTRDTIDIKGKFITGLNYNSTSGNLALYSGKNLEGNIKFSSHYTSVSNFKLEHVGSSSLIHIG